MAKKTTKSTKNTTKKVNEQVVEEVTTLDEPEVVIEKKIKKEKDEIKKSNDNERLIKIIMGVVIAIVLVLAIIIPIVKNSNNQEKQLEKYMKELGKVYYEDIYFEAWGEDSEGRTKLLSSHTSTGINTDLSNLARTVSGKNGFPSTDEILEKFVNKKTGKSCSKTATKVYFYPTEPFGKTNYKMEVKLDCGFDKKAEK